MRQPKQKPIRIPPPKQDSKGNPEKAEKQDPVRIAINGHFGVQEGKMQYHKLWESKKSARYRVNWWSWEENSTVIKSEFVSLVTLADGTLEVQKDGEQS